MLLDSYQRRIKDLRISLTDRCNFRCFYCRPVNEAASAAKESILTFEEITYIAEIFVGLGIEKIRLTGGEPLLRKDLEGLVGKIALLKYPNREELQNDFKLKDEKSEISNLKSVIRKANPRSAIRNPRLKDLAMTTNGGGLKKRAEKLKLAGLDRVTISLDSLERENFRRITGVDRLEEVLDAVRAAQAAGLSPVKINAVIIRGRNDREIVALADFPRQTGVSMRFIEFMPLDAGGGWKRAQVVSGREIFQTINAVFPLKLKENSRGSETAWKYSFADDSPGEIGIIAPVTEMFCGACSRIRLTADGQIRTCLFSTREHNLRDQLRSGAGRVEIVEFIKNAVMEKELRHSIDARTFQPASRTMSFIGG